MMSVRHQNSGVPVALCVHGDLDTGLSGRLEERLDQSIDVVCLLGRDPRIEYPTEGRRRRPSLLGRSRLHFRFRRCPANKPPVRSTTSMIRAVSEDPRPAGFSQSTALPASWDSIVKSAMLWLLGWTRTARTFGSDRISCLLLAARFETQRFHKRRE